MPVYKDTYKNTYILRVGGVVLVVPVSCWRVAGVDMSHAICSGISGGGACFAILMAAAGGFDGTHVWHCVRKFGTEVW